MSPFGLVFIVGGALLIRQIIVGRVRDVPEDLRDMGTALLNGDTESLREVFSRRGDNGVTALVDTASGIEFNSADGYDELKNDGTETFGGVKPWVAVVGNYVKKTFDVTSVGGVGDRPANPSSDHPKGLALDFMVGTDEAKGNRIANFLVLSMKQLGITYVIWNVKINDGSGWRPYTHPSGATDPTSLHKDHVHVSFQATDPRNGG